MKLSTLPTNTLKACKFNLVDARNRRGLLVSESKVLDRIKNELERRCNA